MSKPTKAHEQKVKDMQRIKAAYHKAKAEGKVKTTIIKRED